MTIGYDEYQLNQLQDKVIDQSIEIVRMRVDSTGTKDINKPVPWIIIITIFTPIAIGLMIFGYYSLKGEYDHLPESSDDL